MLNVVMVSVVMLSIIMLIVVAPLISRNVLIEKLMSGFKKKDFCFFSEGDGCKLITKYNNNDSYLIMNIILTQRWWAGKFLGN
jgi:hypothetical protein